MFTNAKDTNIYGGVFNSHIHVTEGQSDILGKYVALGALHNSAERFDPPKCHPHTREAVLKRIMLWVDDPSNQAQIMWIFGPAGAGKSAIAQSIADLYFQSDNLAASFFFSRNSAGRNNSKQLITTLAYQLSRSIPEIRAAVAKAVTDDPLLLSHSLDAQAQYLITRPLNAAVLTKGSEKTLKCRPRLVVIDGLDECGKPADQRYFLDVLSTTAKQLTYPLLFLVASRPEQAIRDAFNRDPLSKFTTRLALDDAYRADSDIKTFLRSKFNEIKQNHPAGGDLPNPWPSWKELSTLVEKSSGQFIYASTVVKFVDSSHHLPQDRLDIVFGLVPPEIATPFAELDTLYHQIFSSVVYIEKALEILTVLLLFEDLSPRPNVLDSFLSYKPGSTRVILSDLHSVLRLPLAQEKEGEIKIVHASLSDFLLDPHRSGIFFIDASAGQNAIIRHILKFVLKQDTAGIFVNVCYLALPTFCAQTTFPGPELLDDLFSFNLSHYVVWFKTANQSLRLDCVEIAAAFLFWMKLKFHLSYEGDLFQHHLQAIDTWILNQIAWLVPQAPLNITTSILLLSFPGLNEAMANPRISAPSDVLVTIAEFPSEGNSTYPYMKISFHMSLSGSPTFDILLREFMAEPARPNERHCLDGETCARLARNLWIYVLRYDVEIKKTTLRDAMFDYGIFFSTTFNSSVKRSRSPLLSEFEPALILLPTILTKVSEASVDTLDNFLQVVQDHPLRNCIEPYDWNTERDDCQWMYDLYTAAAEAAEKHLGPELFELMAERRALRELEALKQDAEVAEPTIETQPKLLPTGIDTDAQQRDVPQLSSSIKKPSTLRTQLQQLFSKFAL